MAEKVGVAVKKPESKGKEPALAKAKAGFSPSVDIHSPVGQMLYLQRTIGNRAVSRLIRSGVLQAKLTVGQPNDIYEQEADRVAGQVMRMPDETRSLVNGHSSVAQRKPSCPTCEEEETPISRKELGGCGGSDVMSCVESHINALKGGGQALSPSTRSFFEPRFRSDFSNVRVHTGSDAAAIATEINAKAFTTGRDIFFNTGQYSPGTTTGKNLLAHELTHVIQQSGTNTNLCSTLQRAVSFKAKFENINLASDLAANISGSDTTIRDADFSADANVTAIGDSEAELNQWDAGILQDMVINWDRTYWKRNNADKKGWFVEKKFKHVTTRYRDQASGTSSVWDADSEHKLLSSLAKTPSGSKFEISTTISTNDSPYMPYPIDGSALPGMDASDGTKNINIRRAGTRFDTYISAHNTVTDEWRHLGRLNWNYQRSCDFTGSGATLAVGTQTGQVGKHGPYGAGKYSPMLSGTTANTAINTSGNYYFRRVAGWT